MISAVSSVGALVVAAVCLSVAAIGWASQRGGDEEVRPGHLVYRLHCARCHGATGLGDGPQAKDLKVRPTNFQSPAFQTKSDDQVLRSIEFGEVDSPMHAWRDRLTDEEIREVLSYLRHLGSATR
ncbi:c-type cytochrome [Candidatus Nitrospira bockiana]